MSPVPQMWFPILIGTILSGYGVVGFVRAIAFQRRAYRVDGVVDGLTAGQGNSGGLYPVLAFTTLDGRFVRTKAGWGGSSCPWYPGQPVDVVYDPRKPERALIANTVRSVVIFHICFALFGGGLTAAFAMPAAFVGLYQRVFGAG